MMSNMMKNIFLISFFELILSNRNGATHLDFVWIYFSTNEIGTTHLLKIEN